MKLDEFINRDSNLLNALNVIRGVSKALEEFDGRFDKKFNLTKLSGYLKINKMELKDVMSLILEFQEMFETIFGNHRIKEKKINGRLYFVLDKKNSKALLEKSVKRKVQKEKKVDVPITIKLDIESATCLSDFTYFFQFVSKGRGIDLKKSSNGFVKDLVKIYEKHPFLFIKNGGGLIYPSEVCTELGNQILAYKKSNKKLIETKINNHIIVFE